MPRTAKRSRDEECPICFELTKQSALRRSFDCHHAVCCSCDDQLFVRRDDRCPVCRAPRRSDSEQAQTQENKQRRAEALTDEERPMLVFLPVSGPGLQEVLQGLLTAPTRAQAVGSFLGSEPVAAAISALVNADALPIPRFHRETRAMRSRTRRRNSASGEAHS